MTQVDRILKYLDDFGSISTMQAFRDLGITRLASRIHEIKQLGIRIATSFESAKNRYGETVSYAVYTREDV